MAGGQRAEAGEEVGAGFGGEAGEEGVGGLDDGLAAFPAQRFIRVRPVRVPRPYHAANEGAVRRKDDLDFWLSMNPDFGVPYGPWGFNSGMGVEDVDRIEAEQLGLIAPGETIAAPDRQLNDTLSAGIRDLDQDTREELKQIFGPQIREAGDRLEWTGINNTAPIPRNPIGGIASVEQIKHWLGNRVADLSGDEFDIIVEARRWPDVDRILTKGDLPPRDLAELLAQHPRHPATVAMRIWGNDEREFAELINAASPNAVAWRDEVERVLMATRPEEDLAVVWRGWKYKSDDRRSASLESLDLEAGIFRQQRVGMSASRSLAIATDRFIKEHGMVWEIRAPKTARSMAEVFEALGTKYAHEQEIIFPRGSVLSLTESRFQKVGKYPSLVYRVYEEL